MNITDNESYENARTRHLKTILGGMNPFSEKFHHFPLLFSKRFGPGSIDLGNVGIYIPQINSKIPKPVSRRRIIVKSLKVKSQIIENYWIIVLYFQVVTKQLL